LVEIVVEHNANIDKRSFYGTFESADGRLIIGVLPIIAVSRYNLEHALVKAKKLPQEMQAQTRWFIAWSR
jgi:hypothetical protein